MQAYEMDETYEPSPFEIWRECAGIQATWTAEEERKRRGAAGEPWRPPGCNRVLRVGSSCGVVIRAGIG